MKNKMRRVILTGATGAVGTALIRELIERNIEVLVFCRKDSKRIHNIPKHPLISIKYCALEDLGCVQNDVGKVYDVFYHFAWSGTVGDSRNDMYVQNLNIKYALDAVGAAKRFGCHTFVGAGSQAEYGETDGKLKADTPAFPRMGYGYAKLCAGQMTRTYAKQNGMKHIWVRILSIYGPNDGMQSMIMSTIEKLRVGIVPKFTKGEQKWDYLYSADAAKAFCLVGEKGIDGKIYILGSGKAKLLKEYIQEMRDIIAPEAVLDFGAIPYGENQVMYLCADISDLEKDVGWRPETDFGDGIKKMVYG